MHPFEQDHQLAGMAALSAALVRKRGNSRLVVPGVTGQQQTVRRVKVGRNDPCPCGSGKKFKKCHGGTGAHHRPASQRPQERPLIAGATVEEVNTTAAPAAKQATARAMLAAKIPERIVWAYLETGIFVTEQNRVHQDEATLATWDAALAAYDSASPEDRRILEVEE